MGITMLEQRDHNTATTLPLSGERHWWEVISPNATMDKGNGPNLLQYKTEGTQMKSTQMT